MFRKLRICSKNTEFGILSTKFYKKMQISKKERKKEGLTSVSPSRDDVGDALSTQKEANYASHTESPNRNPEKSHTRCRVKIQNTDIGRDRSKGGKGESYELNETMYWRKKNGEREEENSR